MSYLTFYQKLYNIRYMFHACDVPCQMSCFECCIICFNKVMHYLDVNVRSGLKAADSGLVALCVPLHSCRYVSLGQCIVWNLRGSI